MNVKAFNNIRVLDCTTDDIGPIASEYLAMAGMEVVRVDNPNRERTRAEQYSFVANNLNKKCVRLNYDTPEGLAVLKEMIAKSDVLIENLTYAQIDRMGLTYDLLKESNPRLIVVSIKMYSRGSRWEDCPADSSILQAMGGACYITGLDEREPLNPGPNLADTSTCAFAATGAVAALIQRLDTGKGQLVEVSAQEAVIAHSRSAYEMYHEYGLNARPGNGFAYFREMAPQNLYRAKGDDSSADWITLGCPQNREFALFCRTIGREDLIEDPRFATPADRKRNIEELDALISDWTKDKDKNELMDLFLRKNRVVAGAVRSMAESIADKDLLKNGLIQKVETPELGEMWFPTYPANYADRKVEVEAPEWITVEEVAGNE